MLVPPPPHLVVVAPLSAEAHPSETTIDYPRVPHVSACAVRCERWHRRSTVGALLLHVLCYV